MESEGRGEDSEEECLPHKHKDLSSDPEDNASAVGGKEPSLAPGSGKDPVSKE